METYKGFNKDMTAKNGFQYKEGKEYEEEKAVACECGFRACEYPLDCFGYYSPANSVYHIVEQSGELSKNSSDTKVASTKIKIGAEISIAGLVKAAIEYTKEKAKPESDATGDYGASSATGYYGASSATGDRGASSATGYYGASSATGDYGASSATGDYGASSATGKCSASSATGDYGASSATGDYGASSATGYYGASSATGKCSASSATGYCGSAIAGNPESVAVAWGYKSKAKGIVGAYIVLADWEENGRGCSGQKEWSLKSAKMVRIDGEKIKADTWYTMENGEIVEVEE
nr:MAG TPA: hypothetical protein [Caudoviricetes sp.]